MPKKVSEKSRIYLDYASLTPIDPRVLKVMMKYSNNEYANPSSWYKEGVAAKKVLDNSRKLVANFIHAHPDEIIFTSGGTEANNLAILGVLRAIKNKGGKNIKQERPHIIISEIEHSSIREIVLKLENDGCEVTQIPVDSRGVIILDELKKSIKPNTVLVSIMTVNNETGAIQPIREIAKIVRHARSKNSGSKYPLFHTDAAQATLYQDLNVEQLGVDLMTLDGGKVYGPRGIGALYVKRSILNKVSNGDGALIEPTMIGGGQEFGMRSGTENIPAIAGLVEALEIIGANNGKDRTKEIERVGKLRNDFMSGLSEISKDIEINGDKSGASASPHILNISIPNIDNEFLLFQLDAAGVACSTKSSCLRDDNESYVLRAMGAESKTALRFSFGRWTKKADIQRALRIIKSSVTISPTC